MESFGRKPVILTFVGNYLPGYKAGGMLRTVVNAVDHLCNDFEFWIVTRDRDLGNDKPYPNTKINQWQQVGNAMVYYLPPRSITVKNILKLIVSIPHHALFLNSFFDPLTINVLLNRKLHKLSSDLVIVAPCGEFGWASLKQKILKKFIFIQIARVVGLYKNVIWRASSEFERLDIIKFMKVKSDWVHVVEDLPIKGVPDIEPDLSVMSLTNRKGLKIVFLSRISREKNLDYALKILKKVNAVVVFDIYGPAENRIYWRECQELMAQLPANVTVNYLGSVNANQVVNIFSRYNLFLFPTGGEAYGHVIAESLTSGTQVLISTETPWCNLQADGLGWDVDLTQMDSFVEIIERLALLSDDEHLRKRAEVKAKIVERLLDPAILESNRQLFRRR